MTSFLLLIGLSHDMIHCNSWWRHSSWKPSFPINQLTISRATDDISWWQIDICNKLDESFRTSHHSTISVEIRFLTISTREWPFMVRFWPKIRNFRYLENFFLDFFSISLRVSWSRKTMSLSVLLYHLPLQSWKIFTTLKKRDLSCI